MTGKIVILNGISSSGKTSVAQAVQKTTEQLFLRISIDDFYGLLPDWFRHSRSEQWPTINRHMQEALFQTVAVLANQENNVVVDTVLIDQWDLRRCAFTLHQYNAFFVGLYCPIEEAERREQMRGDRVIGIARWQFPLVHAHGGYDLELDTSRQTPQQCAATIHERLGNNHKPEALTRLFQSFPPTKHVKT